MYQTSNKAMLISSSGKFQIMSLPSKLVVDTLVIGPGDGTKLRIQSMGLSCRDFNVSVTVSCPRTVLFRNSSRAELVVLPVAMTAPDDPDEGGGGGGGGDREVEDGCFSRDVKNAHSPVWWLRVYTAGVRSSPPPTIATSDKKSRLRRGRPCRRTVHTTGSDPFENVAT